MSKMRAVVIGISHYLNDRLPSLPAAQTDAVRVARALTHWGISEISLFLNEQATIEQLTSFLAKEREVDQFVFYFCGHGERKGDSIPRSDLHFFDGRFELDSLIHRIYQSEAQENYLFIDACSLRLNTILNPKLEDEIRGQKYSQKSFFCLLSSGIQDSFENHFYGYFTDALLRTLAKLRKKEPEPTQLFKEICDRLESEDLPLPEMYNIGTQKISFLYGDSHPPLHRLEMQAKIEDALILNQQKIGVLVGEKGSGKTTLSQSFLSQAGKTFYVKAPPVSTSIPLIEYLAMQLKNTEDWPYSLILIDEAERLDLKQFIESTAFDQTQFLLVSSHSLKEKLPLHLSNSIFQIELDPFSFEEAKELLLPFDYTENEKKLIWLASRGNPLKIKQLAQYLNQNAPTMDATTKKEMLKVISAIYSCGSFIEKKLFADVFGLSLSSIDLLEELGLIHWDTDAWVPHILLNEIAESESAMIRVDQEKALEYWCRQFKPKQTKRKLGFLIAALTFLVATACLGFYLLPTPPHHIVNLRQIHPDFVGRETYLNQLRGICLKSKKSPSIAVLWGEAGIGKSEIATAFANESARHFHVIGWIDSETDESYAASYYTLAKLLEIPIDKETDVIKKVHHYLEIENEAQPWLLILDNAEQNRELPATGSGSVIVTTRNRTHWPLQNCIEVTSFQENEAIDLFKKITNNLPQNYELIKELDFFPLTLNLAAHYIAETPDMNEESYLKLLSQNELELISSMPEDTRYPNTLLSSWNLKADELAEKDREVLEWLHFCSYLCPSGIPSFWIEQWLADQKKGGDPFELKIRSGDILRTLVHHSLMRFEKQTHTLSLHHLNQEVMKKDRYFPKDNIDWIAQFLISRSEKIEKIYEKEKTLSQWDHLREWEPHAAWFLSHSESSLSKEKEASLQNLLANWKFIKGDYKAAQIYHEQALERRTELFGKEHPQTIISMNNLATVLWENGQLAQSKELFTNALTASKKLYPEEHIDVTITMNNLGWVSWEMGEFQEAKTLLKQSLLTSKKLRACDPDFLQTANDFIQVLDDLDSLSDSEKATTRALFLRHAGLWVAEVEGNPNKSIGYFKESLELLQQSLPENDPRIALALGSLGISLNRAGQSEEGQYYLSEAVKIQKLILGDDHPETAKSYANLAISLLNLKKFHEAFECHRKALDIRRKVLGEEHPITAKSYSGTGMALLNLKKPQEALFYNQKALTVRQKVLGESHSETAQSYSRLGINYSRLGQHEKALELNLKALEILNKNFGENHFLTANAYSSLGICYRELGRIEEALQQEKRAETIRKLFSR